MLVNPTVVHYDHGVWGGKWLHVIKELHNKSCEAFSTERSFNNAAVQNTILERERRENRESA